MSTAMKVQDESVNLFSRGPTSERSYKTLQVCYGIPKVTLLNDAGIEKLAGILLPLDAAPEGIAASLHAQLGAPCARMLTFLQQWEYARKYKIAADGAGVTFVEVTLARRASPLFDALHAATEAIINVGRHVHAVEALHTRAVEGVAVPVFQGGEHVGDKTEYSDRLLEVELAAGDPRRYGKQQQGGAAGGAQINLTFNLSGPSPSTDPPTYDLAGEDAVLSP